MKRELQQRMECCSIVNGYDGLDSLMEFSKQNPVDASSIAWELLTSRPDPGKDDHALCDELVKLIGELLTKAELESRVEECWSQVSPEIRENLLSGVISGVFSNSFIKTLFYSQGSGTVERHRIVARLASCRLNESRELLSELMKDIGKHDDPDRQKILESFLTNLQDVLATTAS